MSPAILASIINQLIIGGIDLITVKIINKVKLGITKILKTLPRKKIATTSLKKNGLIIIVKNDKQIVNIINEIAPEHLEINVKNYRKYDKKIFCSVALKQSMI